METPKRGSRGAAGIGSRGESSLRASSPAVAHAPREGPLGPSRHRRAPFPAARLRPREPPAPPAAIHCFLENKRRKPAARTEARVCLCRCRERQHRRAPNAAAGPEYAAVPAPPGPWEPRLLATPGGAHSLEHVGAATSLGSGRLLPHTYHLQTMRRVSEASPDFM